MKTLFLIAAVAAGFCMATPARAQNASATSRNNATATASGGTATATITRRNSRTVVRRQQTAQTAIVTQTSGIDGVIARATRSGDPVQMVNPTAPASYGTGRDVTRHEVDDPYQRPQGIKLVTVEF